MKKRLLSIVLAMMTALTMAGCGGKSEDSSANDGGAGNTESTQASEKADSENSVAAAGSMDVDYDPEKYVTLGEYLGVKVSVSGDYSTDEKALTAYMQEKLGDVGYEKDDNQTEVQEDSIVNVDYTGYQDGVAFDGGAATDQTLDVMNNCSVEGTGFIDGFTAGLPGHKVGETVSYEVTFPEDYGAPNLAGQTVVFEFKINYIAKPSMTVEDLDDAYVAEHFDGKTLDEFKTQCQKELEEKKAEEKVKDLRAAVIKKVTENATISGYPEDVVQNRVNANISSYVASAGGESAFESFLSSYYGITKDAFEKELKDSIEKGMESEMVFFAIAKKENLEVTDVEFEDYCEKLMEKNGIASKEELFKVYATDAAEAEAYLRHICLCDQAADYCTDMSERE